MNLKEAIRRRDTDGIMRFAAGLLFWGGIFWIKNTSDPLGWPVMEIAIVALLARLVWRKGPFLIPAGKVLTALILFLLWCVCTTFWSPNFHATLTAFYKVLALAGALIVFGTDNENWRHAVRSTAVTVSLAAAVFWIVSQHFRDGWVTYPNLFYGFLALGGLLTVGIFLSSSGLKRWAALAASTILAVVLFLSSSLGPVMAWCAGTVFRVSAGRDPERAGWRGARTILFLVGGLFILTLVPAERNPFHTLWERRSADRFSSERIQIWKDSAHYFFSYPVAGSGLGTFRDVYPEFKRITGVRNAPYAHNEILNLACEIGSVGLILLAWLAFLVFRSVRSGSSNGSDRADWIAVLIASGVHALVDFNLRYPPIALLIVFSAACVLPVKEFPVTTTKLRIGLSLFLVALLALFALPAIASLVFYRSEPGVTVRRRAALVSSRFDPFNGLYLSQTGRMRDLMIAIDLEPRNVWYRRKAVQFYIHDWKKDRNEASYRSAIEHYEEILRLAPNVAQFRKEYEEILRQ